MKIKIIAVLALMFLIGSAALAAIGQVYMVKVGDTLWRIIQKEYGIDDPKIIAFLVAKVAGVNLLEPNKIRAGDKILLPKLSRLLELEDEQSMKTRKDFVLPNRMENSEESIVPVIEIKRSSLIKSALSLSLIFFLTGLVVYSAFRRRKFSLSLKAGLIAVALIIVGLADCKTTSSGASFDISDFRYSTRELSYVLEKNISQETILEEQEEDELAEKRATLYKDILTIYYVQANLEAAKEDEWLDGWLGAGDLFKHRIIPAEERKREAEAFDKYLEKYEPMEKSYYYRMSRYHNELIDICKKYGLNPVITTALMWVESRGLPNAVSPAGAIGLLQLMPGTAEIVFGIKNPDELFDVSVNIELGSRYLLSLWERFKNLKKALGSYNWGPGNVKQKGIPEWIKKDFIYPVLWSAEIFSRPMLKNANFFDLFLWQKA